MDKHDATNLGNVAHVDLTLEALHTLVLGLSADATLGQRALAASTLHTDTVDDVSLLGLHKSHNAVRNARIETL
jgi:hypothetical protein